MAGLRLEEIGKIYGSLAAVQDVTLDFPQGKFVCLLGPSGCGKTTLLRLIAGLETPTTGRVLLDGKDLTEWPAHKREFGMVFQSLALFPHLTVGENVAYALRIRGADRPTQRKRAQELLELVRLPGVIDRHISQLSGGQRQRVAIARALALNPKLFLLDEPLSALDAKLREAMQVELRLLQQRLGISTIVVTHDQREAMTMADIVVIMDHGRVQQVASPLDTYRSPANAFVADFIGTSNLIAAILQSPTSASVQGRAIRIERLPQGVSTGAQVTLSVRPEEVHIRPAGEAGENRISGEITFIRDLGASIEVTARCADAEILAVMTPRERPSARIGDPVMVELPAPACVVLKQ
ncbi:ABC transporter ATP-binding protein [Dongia deserti]|uniref:ABC transporter ATP-binding protein n=1 Tax=Dongia deserti TaxID=2268030 RepID=UPI000E64D31A|nr:ABC transporter ATP-binding protein [Dongia deserti]